MLSFSGAYRNPSREGKIKEKSFFVPWLVGCHLCGADKILDHVLVGVLFFSSFGPRGGIFLLVTGPLLAFTQIPRVRQRHRQK